MKEKCGKNLVSMKKKLKAGWLETDIPLQIKVKLWRCMKDNTTYKAWCQGVAKLDFEEEEASFVRNSKDTYNALKKELENIPLSEISRLDDDVKQWVLEIQHIDENELRNQSINMPIKDRLDSKIIEHDTRIFNESNIIMSEEFLLDYLACINGGPPIVYPDEGKNIGEFLQYFGLVSNQYITPEIRNSCDLLCNAIEELGQFILNEFASPNRLGSSEYIRLLPSETRYEYYHNSIDPEYSNSKLYWERFEKVQELRNNCEKCIREYRAYIQAILYI